jgi:hypothetical protein
LTSRGSACPYRRPGLDGHRVAVAGRSASATRCAGTAREGVVQVTVPRPTQGGQGV